MSNVITLNPRADVHKIYTASDAQLLELIFAYDVNIDSRQNWFEDVAKSLSTASRIISAHKIKHIFYGQSKLTNLERIPLEDMARHKLSNSLRDDNIVQFSLHLRGRG